MYSLSPSAEKVVLVSLCNTQDSIILIKYFFIYLIRSETHQNKAIGDRLQCEPDSKARNTITHSCPKITHHYVTKFSAALLCI